MQLSKSFTKYNEQGHAISSLGITIEYNTDTETVDRIVSVDAWDYHSGVFIDITQQMTGLFDLSLNLVIDQINWVKEYADYEEVE